MGLRKYIKDKAEKAIPYSKMVKSIAKNVKEPIIDILEGFFHYREGQLAIAKAERLEKLNQKLENKVLDLASENKKEIQKIHNDYADLLGIVAHD